MKIITKNQKQTIELGKKIARKLRGGMILGLEGELGAGKTTLIKGIAKELGFKKAITSPTFVLMKVYRIKNYVSDSSSRETRRELRIMNFVHVDAYRIRDERELIDIGIEEYLGKKDTILVIEWAEKVRKLLRDKKVVWIKILGKKENEREIDLRF